MQAPFDNSAVAGGFVAWGAEWGRTPDERNNLQQALHDASGVPEESCLELELCRFSGDVHTIASMCVHACMEKPCFEMELWGGCGQ